MDMLRHAHLARVLVDRCGGVEAIVANQVLTRGLQPSRLRDYLNPNKPDAVMPADVIHDLEAYCGEPTYSRALYEARPASAEAVDPMAEACGVIRDASALLQLTQQIREKHTGATARDRQAAYIILSSIEGELRGWIAALQIEATGGRP